MSKPVPDTRDAYKVFSFIQTRWMDNDVYRHVNNVNYYSYFDTAVNRYLIKQGALDIETSTIVGLVVETKCSYFAPIKFPQNIDAGLRVTKIGTSSVRYEIGLFIEGEETAAAQGYFVHVYVDRETTRPTSLPGPFRKAVDALYKET